VARLNDRFEQVRLALADRPTGAGAGEGVAALRDHFDVLAWADPFLPDGDLPASVASAMSAALARGEGSHYDLPVGSDALRGALAEREGARLGRVLDPASNILVTPGSDSGLFYALMSVLNPGDDILVPTPSYPSNLAIPPLLGARAISVPLRSVDDYRIDVDALARATTPRTRAVVLTHPNNPTTTVQRPEDLEELATFLVERDLVLVCDQAFEDLVFDGRQMLSPAAIPSLWERTITVHSFSKGFGLSGLRVGYLVAHERMLAPLLASAVLVMGAPNTLAQVGAVAALADETILAANVDEFEARRTLLHDALHGMAGVIMRPAQSGILSWVDISALGSSVDVARHLRDSAGVLVNEGDAYGPGGEGHLRIVHGAFRDRERFAAAVERMRTALLELSESRAS
jgi:aspartate/methionine/tyrosine aminotransferase